MRNPIVLLFVFYSIAAIAFPFNGIQPRQKAGGKETGSVDSNSNTTPSNADSGSATNTNDSPQDTGKATGTGSSNQRSSITPNPSRASHTRNIMAPPNSPPGSITMQTPAITDGPQYYKIGDNITFVWNYTDIIISPTALNVLAVCSDQNNDQTLTLSRNMSVSHTSLVWDTLPFSNGPSPLVMATYTLVIYDSSREQTAYPSPGYMAPYSLRFGMYSPSSAVPLASYQCAVCENSGVGNIDQKLMRMLLGTGTIFFMSFFLFLRIFL